MQEFEKICQAEYQAVWKFLMRLCGNKELAQELTQETFYQAMKQWKSFRGQCAPSTWLCGIAKRLYFSYCRKPPPLPVESLPEAAASFDDDLLSRERRLQAHALLHSLPEPYREVVTLRTFGDLSHEEIGAIFGKPATWARTTYYRGRQMLVHRMKGENQDE